MGLLDILNTPAGVGLLSGVASYAMNARRNTPINNLGRGFAGGLTGYAQANDQIRQDKEKQLADQYRQMQIQQMESEAANQKGMRESLQSLYKPAGTQAFKPDDPFNEGAATFGENNLKNETNATFGGKPVDPVMAAVLPYAQPDTILKLMEKRNNPSEQFGKIMPHSYTPESLSAYQQSGNYSDLKPIGVGAAFGKVNPGQFTPESLARYAESGQYGDLVPFRSPTQIDQGGQKVLRDPGTGQETFYPVSPKPEQMPQFQGAQESAKVTARNDAETKINQPRAAGKVDAEQAKLKRLEGVISTAKKQSGLLSTGLVGQATAGIGGTPAHNLGATLDTIKANLGFDELQQMRDNSPTGGALGQVAVQEIAYLQSVVGNLTQSQSQEQLDENLDIVLQAKRESNERMRQAYEATYGEGANDSIQSVPPTRDESAYVRSRRQQGASDEQIAKEMTQGRHKQKDVPAQSFALPPNAKQYEGKTIRDTKTGKRFQAKGGKWVEIK